MSPAQQELLNLPEVERVRYERNLISSAVCELRFPYLVDYEDHPPRQLQSRIRKQYPHPRQDMKISVSGTEKAQPTYLFDSRQRDWTVVFRPFSIGLETKSYKTFEQFLHRLEALLTEAQPLLDTDFFTRVGLRYINHFPVGQSELDGWLNQELSRELLSGVYGKVSEYQCHVRGACERGFFLFRHGLIADDGERYGLDADFYAHDLEWADLVPTLRQFNETNFKLFSWALGPTALEHMGEAKSKETKR